MIYELYYRLCPPKLPQPSGAVHSIWWLGFFFDFFSYSGLRAFFTSDFTNCTTDYAPPNYPNHQVLFTASDGWVFFFFDLFSYSGLRAFFTSDFTNCTTDYAPPQLPHPSGAVHSIWWLGFFFDLFSYSGLRAFLKSDFTNCTTDYAPPQINPTIRCCSEHLMVGVFFFFDLFSYSGLRAFFTSYFMNCTTDYAPPPKLPQPSGAVQSIWWLGFFFLTSSLILDLEHFSQVILWIVLQIMPLQINPTIRCCSQHLMVGFFFWPLLLFWT